MALFATSLLHSWYPKLSMKKRYSAFQQSAYFISSFVSIRKLEQRTQQIYAVYEIPREIKNFDMFI